MTKTLLTLLLAASLPASAAQVLNGKPDDTLSARVSRSEPTMIRVDGQHIRRIFGAEGDFTVTSNQETGTAFLKPVTDKPAFSVFVSDAAGRTWKLLLAVSDGPSESIVIKGRSASTGDRTANASERDQPRNRIIKRVLLALDAEGESDLDAKSVNQIIPLWDEALFVLVKLIDGPLKGEKYLLTNASSKPMQIDERELYRPGVVAISVAKPKLLPAETTEVYVISEASDHD